MAKRLVALLAAVVCVYLLYLGYIRYKNSAMSDNGAVQDDTGAAVVPTPSRSDDASSTPPPQQKAKPAVAPAPVTQAYTSTTSAPVTDTIQPNPPNGTAFTGTGKFQVYRQGNLTWRIDTESGTSCILFATLEEWRKPVVYRHACN